MFMRSKILRLLLLPCFLACPKLLAQTSDQPPKHSVAIYAVIVGATANPWTSVDASMVDSMTVIGGVAAIGSLTLLPTGSNNGPLLTIEPDLGYLSGARIPPITPNVFDVRIISSDESLFSP